MDDLRRGTQPRPLPQRGVDDLRGTEQRAVDDPRRDIRQRAHDGAVDGGPAC